MLHNNLGSETFVLCLVWGPWQKKDGRAGNSPAAQQGTAVLAAAEINIYSHRQPFLINPFLEAFTRQTGIKTNVVYSTKGLAQRVKATTQCVLLLFTSFCHFLSLSYDLLRFLNVTDELTLYYQYYCRNAFQQ